MSGLKISIFGSTGAIGKVVVREAVKRGHEVTAVVRDLARWDSAEAGIVDGKGILHTATGDVLRPDSVTEAARGMDVVISAYGPRFGEENDLPEATRSLIEGVRRAEAGRLIVVGGAGSLEVEPGVRLMDTPEFPEEIRPLARAHSEALDIIRESDIDWTVLCPAAVIEPGKRTGDFRIGMDRLIIDERDVSHITIEDFAVAMLDEIEDPQFIRSRFTVAY